MALASFALRVKSEHILIVVGCFRLLGLTSVHQILYFREHLLVFYNHFLRQEALHVPWKRASLAVQLRLRAHLPNINIRYARIIAVFLNHLALIDKGDVDHLSFRYLVIVGFS